MNKVKIALRAFLAALRAKPLIGGLEIADSGMHFMFWNGSAWETKSIRLVPGVVVRGEIKNRKEFIDALRLMRSQVFGGKKKRAKERISVIVSLSSVNIYTQVFNLPVIEGENLEKAVQLNIQMASPTGASDSYAGWQLVNPTQENMRLEILSAFLSRSVVDELIAAMHETGFVPVAVESRALSLARVIKETEVKFDIKKSLIVVSVDASGLDVLVVRGGHLHFDYFNSWQDLQGDQKTLSLDAFRAFVLRSINQVFNFYNAHWSDPVTEVLVSAVGLKDEVMEVVKQNFELPVRELTPMVSPPVGPEWFVALGGGLRGRTPRREDKDVSLLGIDAQEEFRREQALHFTYFWRALTPITIGILLVVFGTTLVLLSRMETDLAKKADFQLGNQEVQDIAALRARAEEFNKLVGIVAQIEATARPKVPLLQTLLGMVSDHSISVSRMYIQSTNAPVQFIGGAKSEDDIIAFKTALAANSGFKDVNLPLTNITKSANGYSFSVTFTINSVNTN